MPVSAIRRKHRVCELEFNRITSTVCRGTHRPSVITTVALKPYPVEFRNCHSRVCANGHSAPRPRATAIKRIVVDELYVIENRVNPPARSEEHTSELQSRGHLVCRLLLEKKNPT